MHVSLPKMNDKWHVGKFMEGAAPETLCGLPIPPETIHGRFGSDGNCIADNPSKEERCPECYRILMGSTR